MLSTINPSEIGTTLIILVGLISAYLVIAKLRDHLRSTQPPQASLKNLRALYAHIEKKEDRHRSDFSESLRLIHQNTRNIATLTAQSQRTGHLVEKLIQSSEALLKRLPAKD